VKQKRRPSKLKSVKQPKHWGLRLDQFRLEYDLSIRDLTGVLENRIGKTTVHRICSGGLDPRMERLVRPIIAESLRVFLRSKGKTEIEIERDICAIFSDPNKEKPMEFTKRALLSRDAQDFFNLRFDPFTGDPRDVSEVFTTKKLDLSLSYVMDAVKFQGFMALIGEVGEGKTIAKRRAVEECKKSKGKLRIFFPEFMNMEKVHSGSIASFVLRQCGESAPRDLVARAERLKQLLVRLSADQVSIALAFDECHRLDPRLLTALKNFWELGDGGFDRYLGLVLFGQPRFLEILADPQYREISERLNIVRLASLNGSAVDYLAHRFGLAGGKFEKVFQSGAVSRMLKLAKTPLALGNVANAALLEAFQMGSKVVLPNFIPQGPDESIVRSVRPQK